MKQNVRILVVDDEEIMRASLSDWLREDGFEVSAVESGRRAIEEVKEKPWNVLLVDLKMPGMDGIDVLREVKKINKDLPVLIITAYATVDSAVQAMKQGAYDYICKPFNPEEISLTLRKIISHQQLVEENIYLRRELSKRYEFRDIISKNHKMLAIIELVKNVAPSNATVLIEGESGTGKEIVARAIHAASPRSEKPFIVVDCGAIPETLLESELFGHEKGAFTGAVASKRGRFELADKGTIFLDEIGEMSLKTQVDLLRVVQQKELRRVGSEKVTKIDVRVIAATNKDLRKAVEEGKFREDLFYRLNVVSIKIPPLRERKEDIPLLADHFIKKYSVENKKKIEHISQEALNVLMRHDWPGNVRELENVIERAVVLGRGSTIFPEDLPAELHQIQKVAAADKSLEAVEREHILNVLNQNNWNITKSASILNIDRSTLYKKIEKYSLNR